MREFFPQAQQAQSGRGICAWHVRQDRACVTNPDMFPEDRLSIEVGAKKEYICSYHSMLRDSERGADGTGAVVRRRLKVARGRLAGRALGEMRARGGESGCESGLKRGNFSASQRVFSKRGLARTYYCELCLQ